MPAEAVERLPASAKRLGEVGLQGWRKPVADVAAQPLSKVAPVSHSEVRALVGLGFVAVSAWYLASTLSRFLRTQ
jgi:hypothetical protein